MFEKEAEEYCNALIQNEIKVKSIYDIEVMQKDLEKFFQDAAEFGYNKANEWHYVKDGDLPSDRHGHVVINQDWDKVTIRNGRFEYLDGGKADVIAWKEIVLPKEIKEKWIKKNLKKKRE